MTSPTPPLVIKLDLSSIESFPAIREGIQQRAIQIFGEDSNDEMYMSKI
eukprot:CAMPEP_0197843230 /NCGR_PEP_ID=MMETSP1438-20131217/55_1 /TAXON_ID=1461541 /ORGANISM="Pterosperma sp., Strain CCMP1384" /LENGTH=48 /DNA_ID= /DNA_START= /DNA_END= /DNA_ORIENTATION=